MAALYIHYSSTQISPAFIRFYRKNYGGFQSDYFIFRSGGGYAPTTTKIGSYDDYFDNFTPNYNSIYISLTAGNDVVTFDRKQYINTHVYGKGGVDTLVLNANFGKNLVIDLRDGNSAYDETRVKFSSIENIVGGPRNDKLTGTDQANEISGGAGNDTLIGGAGDDTLKGGVGSDRLFGGSGDDVIYMGDRTGEDIDIATGGSGADIFLVVDSEGALSPHRPEASVFDADMLVSALDSFYGKTKLIGAGNPLVAMALSVGTDTAAQWLRQLITGGESATPHHAKEDYVEITDFNPVEDMFIYKTESSNVFFYNDLGQIEFNSDQNSNNTGGLLASLTIDGVLVGKIQSLTKMQSVDIRRMLAQSQGMQTLYLRKNSAGKAEIQLPGEGFISLENSMAADELNPEQFVWKSKVIQAANSYVANSRPNDVVVVTGAFSSAIVQGASLPGDNMERVLSGTRFGDVFYSHSLLNQRGAVGVALMTTHAFGWGGDDNMFGSRGIDVFYGGDGSDLLKGAEGDDFLYGEAGSDQLEGGDGNDHLYGGQGDDSLYGMNGNNYFDGGAGVNGINGSGRAEDSNTLHYGPELGFDIVRDFAGSNDRLIFGAGLRWEDIAVQQTGNDLNLSVGAGGMVVVKDHFAGKGIEAFQVDSQTVTANQVNLLVQAMGASGGWVSAAPLGSFTTTRPQDTFSVFG